VNFRTKNFFALWRFGDANDEPADGQLSETVSDLFWKFIFLRFWSGIFRTKFFDNNRKNQRSARLGLQEIPFQKIGVNRARQAEGSVLFTNYKELREQPIYIRLATSKS